MGPTVLTGRRRFRSERRGFALFGRTEILVLQVEERGYVLVNAGNCVESEQVVVWRDATTADLTTGGGAFETMTVHGGEA